MQLIIVARSAPETYARLKAQFADDLNVEVVKERRVAQRRYVGKNRGPERRSKDRRKFVKPFNGRDYIVIYTSG